LQTEGWALFLSEVAKDSEKLVSLLSVNVSDHAQMAHRAGQLLMLRRLRARPHKIIVEGMSEAERKASRNEPEPDADFDTE
jgi:hypothetical protein